LALTFSVLGGSTAAAISKDCFKDTFVFDLSSYWICFI